MTFSEWYKGLDKSEYDALEGVLSNLAYMAWKEGYEQGMREEEDRHIGKDL